MFSRGNDPRRVGSEFGEWLSGFLEAKREGEVWSRPHLYGSDAGFCARRNVLLAHNEWVGNEVNSSGKGYMAIGVAFEELLTEALRRGGRLLGTQVQPPSLGDLHVSSRIDAFILDREGEVALLEIKTCGEFPREPEQKPQHLAQVQMYAALSGVRNAHLVYMSRNLTPKRPLPLTTFAVETGDEALAKRLTIAALSQAAIQAGRLPPKSGAFRKHTECHYCEFRDMACWDRRRRGGELQEAHPPLPELRGGELARLTANAEREATTHLANIRQRYLETLKMLREGCEGSVAKRLGELEREGREKFLAFG